MNGQRRPFNGADVTIMITQVVRSYQLVLDDARRMLADIRDDQLATQPIDGMNHPAWIIGHLVYSCQMIGGEMGIEPWLPERWIQLFATGTTLSTDRSMYPSKTELIDALDDGQRRVVSALAAMKDEDLDVPLPDERYRATLPTLGQAVLHILTVHTAVHVGQLSAWRRAMKMAEGPMPGR